MHLLWQLLPGPSQLAPGACPALQSQAHLHDLEGALHALLIVVADPHSLGQPQLLALRQALIVVVVLPAVDDGKAGPVLLV